MLFSAREFLVIISQKGPLGRVDGKAGYVSPEWIIRMRTAGISSLDAMGTREVSRPSELHDNQTNADERDSGHYNRSGGHRLREHDANRPPCAGLLPGTARFRDAHADRHLPHAAGDF